MPFLEAQPSETEGRLPTTPVFLGQLNRELVEHLAVVARHRAIERAITIHDKETVPVIAFKELCKILTMELVVT